MRCVALISLLALVSCDTATKAAEYGVCQLVTQAEFDKVDTGEQARFNKSSTAQGDVQAVVRGSGTMPEYEGSLDGPSLITVEADSVIEVTRNEGEALYLRAPETVVFALDFENYICRLPG